MHALVKMNRTLQIQGEIPVSRMCVTCRYFQPHVHADRAQPHHGAFVDQPFGDRQLCLECADHDAASAANAQATWDRFLETG